MRVGYLGPEGTFSQAAALSAPASGDCELAAIETIHDVVLAVRDGSVDRGVVPIENSLEGSVNVTLDALVFEAEAVRIVGETVIGVEQCLIAQEQLALDQIEVVISHPQAIAQCRTYTRTHMPEARVMTATSTAEAVRLVSERIRHRWAAIGPRLAAQLYDCEILEAGIEDVTGNQTRFVWLARGDAGSGGAQAQAQAGAAFEPRAPGSVAPEPGGVPGATITSATTWKTAIVFWGAGTDASGWLVSCLSELAFRGVNLTRIESRPLRAGLGQYMFFADLDGRDTDPQVADGLRALGGRVEVLRTLGTFPRA